MKILIVVDDVVEKQKIQDLLEGREDVTVCQNADDALREVRKADAAKAQESEDWSETQGTSRGPRLVTSQSSGSSGPSNVTDIAYSSNRGLTEVVEEVEARMVAQAMTKTGNNQIKASKVLKITRGALQYKLKKYRLQKQAA